jgi:hypothetical protein
MRTLGFALLGHHVVSSSAATWQQLFGQYVFSAGCCTQFSFLLLSSSAVFHPDSYQPFYRHNLFYFFANNN